MEYKFNIPMTKGYFSESFDQYIKYGSKWRKIEYIISLIFLVAGIGLFIYSDGETLLPLIFIFIAVFEFISPYLKKFIWIRRMATNKILGKSIEFNINDNGISSLGPYSEGSIKWEGIDRVVNSPKGILIWPQKGLYIYLPKSIVDSEIINFITIQNA